MPFHSIRVTLTALLLMATMSALAFNHTPSAPIDTAGLSTAECCDLSGNANDDTPRPGPLAANLPGANVLTPRQTGTPGTPLRVLGDRHHLTRFPILPQGPPHHS